MSRCVSVQTFLSYLSSSRLLFTFQTTYSFLIQIACVFITLVTLSNGFVLHKKKQVAVQNIEKVQTVRPKRDGDNDSSLAALASSGSISMHSGSELQVEDHQQEEPECRPISEMEINQYGLPIGEAINSTEMADLTDVRAQRYRHQRYHSSTGQCPESLLDTSGHHSVNRNSLCPWTYITDVDIDR